MGSEADAGVRREVDSFGPIDVPADRLWGAQTQRSLTYFRISTEIMPLAVVHALARVKRAAARVNRDLGLLEPRLAEAIAEAATEVLDGRHDGEFPLSVWQTGSGTQTNMNVNEVLANRASELLGGPRGPGRLVHPNDHVNLGQSSNDVFPTAMHLAAAEALERRVRPEAAALRNVLASKARAFMPLVKIGRTHLQDAVPLTLGQEFSGYVAQLEAADVALGQALPPLLALAIGGTAVGTGLNAHPDLAPRVAAILGEETGMPFVVAGNPFAALAGHEAIVQAHGAVRVLAVALTKIVNDIRWLASGPRAGLGEIRIPENEPGSSIMPGKVNPTQAEAVAMACAQVMGNDVAIGIGGASGHFELNTYKPLIIWAFLQSCRLMTGGCAGFREHCAEGIEADAPRLAEHVARSLMLVTALAPHVGYDAAAKIARDAHARGVSLREAALESGRVTAEEFDGWVRPEQMVPGYGTNR
jgi:fumarate hydratase class II